MLVGSSQATSSSLDELDRIYSHHHHRLRRRRTTKINGIDYNEQEKQKTKDNKKNDAENKGLDQEEKEQEKPKKKEYCL